MLPLSPGLPLVNQNPPQLTDRLSPLMHTSWSVLTLIISSGYVGIELKIKISPAPEATKSTFLSMSCIIAFRPFSQFKHQEVKNFPPGTVVLLRSVTIKQPLSDIENMWFILGSIDMPIIRIWMLCTVISGSSTMFRRFLSLSHLQRWITPESSPRYRMDCSSHQ